MKYKHKNRYKVFENQHMSVYEEELILPNGKEVTWTFLRDYTAVGIIAFTPQNELLLVRQYRPAIKDTLLEIPAGLVESGEDIKIAAIRELEEETGYKAKKIKKICEYYRSPGISASKLVIFCAKDLEKTSQNLDEEEFLEVVKIQLKDLEKVFESSLDGKTLFALSLIKLNKEKFISKEATH